MTSEEQEHKRQAAITEYARLMEPIISDLRAVGFEIKTLDELRRSHTKYGRAVPILVGWLSKIQDVDAKESIIRTLSVPWAKGSATRGVLDEFYKAPPEAQNLKWAIGNAMEVIADQSVADEILKIVANRSNGMARQMFVLALGKLDAQESIPVLIELLEQEDVAGHAAQALGSLRAVAARSELQKLTIQGKPWVRKAAAKAISQIEKTIS